MTDKIERCLKTATYQPLMNTPACVAGSGSSAPVNNSQAFINLKCGMSVHGVHQYVV